MGTSQHMDQCILDQLTKLTNEVHNMNKLSYVSVLIMAQSTGYTPDEARRIIERVFDEYDDLIHSCNH